MSKHYTGHEKIKPKTQKNRQNFGLSFYPEYEYDEEFYNPDLKSIVFPALSVLFIIAGFVISNNEFYSALAFCVALCCALVIPALNLFFNIQRRRILCESLLILISSVLVCIGKMFSTAAGIALVYVLTKLLCALLNKTSKEKAAPIINVLPEYASLLDGENEYRIRPSHIRQGDILLIKKNEIIPVDAKVLNGMSSADLSPLICGKGVVPIHPGMNVVGGSVNLTDSIVVEAACDYSRSTACVIYSDFLNSIRSESIESEITQKVVNISVSALIVLFIVTGIIYPLFNGKWIDNLQKDAVILLCACPFGILMSMALALFNAVRSIFSCGGVIRNGKVLKLVSGLESFACNKTCTVTESKYSVIEAIPSGISEDELLSILVKVESQSSHPIAKAIRDYCGIPDNIDIPGLIVEENPTKGICAFIGSNNIFAGNAALLFEHGINCAVPEKSGPVVHVAINGNYCGYVLLENKTRPGIWDSLEIMRSCGVKNFALLSGDMISIVRPIAASGSFNIVKAEVGPDGKAASIEYLKSNLVKNETIAFVSDGNNDYKAAHAADISVTTGAVNHTDLLTEYDVSILGEGIEKFPYIVKACKAMANCSKINMIIFAVSRSVILIFGLLGVIGPLFTTLILALCAVFSTFTSSFFFERF